MCESVSVVMSNSEQETTDSTEITVLVDSGSLSTEKNSANTSSSTTESLLDRLQAPCPSEHVIGKVIAGIMGTTTEHNGLAIQMIRNERIAH